LAQDFDLLKTLGDQAARLPPQHSIVPKVLQAKQVEAVPDMFHLFCSRFEEHRFNTLPHAPKPAGPFQRSGFREDALRGVSKTVNHINDLIGRLSLSERISLFNRSNPI